MYQLFTQLLAHATMQCPREQLRQGLRPLRRMKSQVHLLPPRGRSRARKQRLSPSLVPVPAPRVASPVDEPAHLPLDLEVPTQFEWSGQGAKEVELWGESCDDTVAMREGVVGCNCSLLAPYGSTKCPATASPATASLVPCIDTSLQVASMDGPRGFD